MTSPVNADRHVARSDAPPSTLRSLLVGVPRPLLTQRQEAALGPRHREVLDGLETLLREGELAALTIGALAARLECSRRTLYELAPSKEQLFLLALDRFMHRIGHEALEAIDPRSSAAARLRQYVRANVGYTFQAAAFGDLDDVPGARRLLDRHYRFAATVIERLVADGVDGREFRPVEPAVAAAVLLAGTVHIASPEVAEDLGIPLAEAIDEMLDLFLTGLQRS